MEQETIRELIETALAMRKRSYVPYSGFRVGAALLTAEGRIYTGCNIENAAYTPTNCAERTAFFKAVSEGEKHFRAIAIVGAAAGAGLPFDICPPCGVCRQVMMEFTNPETFEVILVRDADHYQTRLLKELLPDGFGPDHLFGEDA